MPRQRGVPRPRCSTRVRAESRQTTRGSARGSCGAAARNCSTSGVREQRRECDGVARERRRRPSCPTVSGAAGRLARRAPGRRRKRQRGSARCAARREQRPRGPGACVIASRPAAADGGSAATRTRSRNGSGSQEADDARVAHLAPVGGQEDDRGHARDRRSASRSACDSGASKRVRSTFMRDEAARSRARPAGR